MKCLAGHYYHIYNRGVDRRNIFTSPENYLFLLRRMKEYLPVYPISLIAYCLMPNHYHFLVYAQVDNGPGLFVQRLFNSYAQAFNLQQRRSGTLFQGRAKSRLIQENEYLYHIARYIHLNPVHAGLVARPEDWVYSNFREFIGLRNGTLFDQEFRDIQFGSPEEYQSFVEQGISQDVERKLLKYLID